MRGKARFRTLLASMLLTVAGLGLAQETGRWMAAEEAAAPYASVEPRIIAAAKAVLAAKIPERLLLERLKEGVRKRAAPDRLAQAMEEEADRLIFLAGELDASGLPLTGEARERALSDGALFLRASISREEYRAVVLKTAAKDYPAERVAATVSALAAIDPSRVVDSPTRLRLAEAIAGSSIKTGRIDSLISAFTRGRSFGLSPDRIARIVSDELDLGGTLMSIDEALNRERKRR